MCWWVQITKAENPKRCNIKLSANRYIREKEFIVKKFTILKLTDLLKGLREQQINT